MLSNIIAVLLGHLYSFAIIYPFMYSLDEKCKTPYDYLKMRYNNKEFPKIVCLLVAMFYYFSFVSLYLWGCAAILNVLIPELNLQMANLLLGLYSVSGTILGGYIQSTKTNIFQFLVAFFGIIFAAKLTLLKDKGPETIEQVWLLAKANNRTQFFDTHVDFTTR
jgi:Na+/proline symporter